MASMKHSPLIPVLVLTLWCTALASPIAQAENDIPEYVAGELVLKLFNAADLSAVATQHGLALPPLDQFGTRPIYRMRILNNVDPLIKADQIKPGPGSGDLRVEFAEPNYLAQAPEGRRGRVGWNVGGDAGTYASQWAPKKLRLPEAHPVSRGAGVTVAVLDTGVDPAHPGLAGRLRPGFDFVDFDADSREEGVYGTNFGFGHGTHVAGLIALTAPEATILPVRILDADGVGSIWVLAEGLRYAVDPDGNPATNDGATVINLSLGTLRRTELLDEIIALATCDDNDDDDDDDNDDDNDDDDDDERCRATGGTVVIAAAGNGGDSVPQYPAAEGVAGLLAVAASTRSDALATFSTRGPWVRLSAPGEEIISTVPGGAYATWSGTSMAAPSAAGVAALLRTREPTLNAAAVVERLVTTAQPLCTEGPPRLDAAHALGQSAVAPHCEQSYLPLVDALP